MYGLTNTAVTILGPYSGKLGNRSDRVAIEAPQYPDLPGDGYSWVIEDEVIYGNQDPWPVTANGAGLSLTRIATASAGNDPGNWIAAPPTPGQSGDGMADADEDGMPNDWERLYGFDPFDSGDAELDSDGDGMTNVEEFLAGTNPHDGGSRLALRARRGSNNLVELEFDATSNRTYRVQWRTAADSGAWQRLADLPAQPSSGVRIVTDDTNVGGAARYYQVVTPAGN
jgi:hypothetical protein